MSIQSLQLELNALRDYVYAIGSKAEKTAVANNKTKWKTDLQSEVLSGIYLALCVSTDDPMNRNRVKFFTPLLCSKLTDVEDLDWAYPVQTFGGFDDSGSTWVPPAGSTLVLSFANGDRTAPFYLGTSPQTSRGPAPHDWGYNIQEFADIWADHRGGYLIGAQDESQSSFPWGSEMYNSVNPTQFTTFDTDPDAYKKHTLPHIYGFKSNEKHMLKFVDGDHRCNKRYKRLELMSSRGIWLMFKDDHLHPCGQWANPNCTQGEHTVGKGDARTCTDVKDNANCDINSSDIKNNVGSNPYFGRKEECRPYTGANTPQNNKCELSQSGAQVQSLSGHQFVMDDSVDQPTGVPRFDLDYTFGCTDIAKCKMFQKSATGHLIKLDDTEDATGVRSKDNGIQLKTASGISLTLSDHATGSKGSLVAGAERGLKVKTTANHVFEMVDKGNKQSSPDRKEGGVPIAKADNAYCLLKTGYGIGIKFTDANSQSQCQQQRMDLTCPQTGNSRGDHSLTFEAGKDTGTDGKVLLRVGGVYEQIVYGNSIEKVGTEDHAADKITDVSNQYVVKCKNFICETDENAIFSAADKILLFAGKDCAAPKAGDPPGPCLAPVIVFQDGVLKISDRVYGTATKSSRKVMLQMVMGT